jgi:predicted short-subunit dehydrogenase-like oxidoreductase (DUF2520 family)
MIRRVYVHGAGKVGAALAARLRRAGVTVTLRAARTGLPKKVIEADVVVLAVRDGDLRPLAEEIARRRLVIESAVCVHVAGALDASPLASLRAVCRGVAQMHPMISFASARAFPTLDRGNLHVQGDAVAVARAKALGKKLGMTSRTFDGLDAVGYHAAAALTANGAVALASAARDLLRASAVPPQEAAKMLGPLLRSVAENIERLGFPEALTGPIRRGDPSSIEKQLGVLRARVPAIVPFFLEACRWQLPLARALGEVSSENLDKIEEIIGR